MQPTVMSEVDISGTTVGDSDVDAWTIALMHSMSKRTKVYAGYNNQEDDNSGGIDRDQFSLGVKHKF